MKTEEEVREALRRLEWLLKTPQFGVLSPCVQGMNYALFKALQWVAGDNDEFQTYLDALARPSRCREN